jgi:hypothetical protein
MAHNSPRWQKWKVSDHARDRGDTYADENLGMQVSTRRNYLNGRPSKAINQNRNPKSKLVTPHSPRTSSVAPDFRVQLSMVYTDNFYTTDPKGEHALQQGYQFLGIACYVFSTQVNGTIPVYRSFIPRSGDHFYTTSRDEFDNFVHLWGYTAEHIAWFMFGERQSRSTVLTRYFNEGTGDHVYCTDANTSKVADFVAYRTQAVAGYVLDDSKYTLDDTRVVPLYWWYYRGPEEIAREVSSAKVNR